MTTTMADPIVIRRAETPAEFRALQDAQRRAWGITEASYIVPVATMVGAQLHGGLVLGTGDFTLKFGSFALGGIGTATFGAILLHALLRRRR